MDAKAEAVRLRDEGLTFEAVAKALGISISTAYLWTSPKAAIAVQRRRERDAGRPVVDRECVGYACHVVILAEEHAKKRFCGPLCRARAKRMRATALAMVA